MKRLSVISLQFYKLLFWYNVAFTITALIMLMFAGIPVNAVSFLVAKIMGYFVGILLHYYNSKNHYYYFRHTGYAMRGIFAGALIADMIAYLIIVFTCLN